jgi:succinate dehydrogenase / fumarate reductase cytochrome b subunit
LLTGIRHLVMDTGSAFELVVNKSLAVATIVGAILLTVLLWVYILGVRP